MVKLVINFKEDPIGSLINIIIYIFIVYILLQIYWAIKGHSWDPLQILSSLILLLITNSIRTEYLRGKFEGKFDQFQENVKESFKRMKEDISKLKRK